MLMNDSNNRFLMVLSLLLLIAGDAAAMTVSMQGRWQMVRPLPIKALP